MLGLPNVAADVRDELLARIDAALLSINKETFRKLEQEIIPLFTSTDADVDGVHGISNLALLAGKDNSALNNSCFEVKRRDILQRDRMGNFIPPATRNAFLKYYTESKAQQVHFWGPHDRDAYLSAMTELVGPYLRTETPHE